MARSSAPGYACGGGAREERSWRPKSMRSTLSPVDVSSHEKRDSNFIIVVTRVTWRAADSGQKTQTARASRSLDRPRFMPLPVVRVVPVGRKDPARREFRKTATLVDVDFCAPPTDDKVNWPFRLEFDVPASPDARLRPRLPR